MGRALIRVSHKKRFNKQRACPFESNKSYLITMNIRNSIRNIIDTLHSNFWNIGFVEEDIRDVLNTSELNVHWLKHNYHDRWFADPFLLKVTPSEVTALVEEFSYKSKKGRIAKLTIQRDGYVLRDMKILLDLPTHLSFPVIYRKDNKVYIMPENSQSGETKIYLYDDNCDTLTLQNVVNKLPLTDATIMLAPDGKRYLFSTYIPYQNGNKLQVYSFNHENLTSSHEVVQEIVYEFNTARNAGDVFTVDGQMYRPSQNCINWYGNGVVIEKLYYSNGVFRT